MLVEGARVAMRQVSRAPVGRRALQQLYVSAADASARALGRVEGVRAVYLTGSVATPASVEPGWSDIDLVLITDLPDLASELAFRARLQPAFTALSTAVPAIAGLDYVDVRDLPTLVAAPNVWSMDFARRWRLLDGEQALPPPAPLPPRYRQLVGLHRALRRWCKAAPMVLTLDHAARRQRIARRLRADVVAYVVGASRHATWDALRTKAQALGLSLPAESSPAACLVSALRALEHSVSELDDEQGGTHVAWQVSGELPPPSPREGRFVRLAAEVGVPRLAARDPCSIRRLCICRIDRPDAERSVDAAAGLMRSLGTPLPPLGPALLTPTLERVAWLLDASPVAAASLALAGDPVPAPSRVDLDLVWRGRVVEHFTRGRGRAFRRYRVTPSSVEQWRELVVGEACLALGRGQPLRFGRPPPTPPQEEVVERLRALALAVRPEDAPVG